MPIDINLFNPHVQDEEDFVSGFVARSSELKFFLRQLKLQEKDQPANHHLVVAPKGFGKTSLLRRIGIELKRDPTLRWRYIPLVFREEQHNVISLDVFWRNCIQSYADLREDQGAKESELDSLDELWEQAAPRHELSREDQDGNFAYQALNNIAEQSKKRLVLLSLIHI